MGDDAPMPERERNKATESSCGRSSKDSTSTSASRPGINGRESPASNPSLAPLHQSQSTTVRPRNSIFKRPVSPLKLYSCTSLQEGREEEMSSSDNAQRDDEIARLPSLDFSAGEDSNFKLDVDSSVPVNPGPMGPPASLNSWNSDLLELPVGEGGPPNKRKSCILSLDGGGMRGLIAARILSHLENILQEKVGEKVKLCDYFDLLAGTSTGAVLATMLVTPDANGNPTFTAEGCCEFYKKNGRLIFQHRWYDPFHGSVRQLYRPKYSGRRFEDLLKKYTFIDGKFLTLLDTLKPLVVTSFDISQATPFFFVRQAAQKDQSRNFRLWEVCRATAAAPTYFPPASVRSVDGRVQGTLIDGGAVQNNPALVATTHAISNNEEFPYVNGLEDVLELQYNKYF
uniref:Patatin n=1 Tax=Physcomitrium patens TaxID=3218 RepID=A0A2K1KLU3_PHYPA|nr:hypothetical protein PHYPA_005641 [Physcomitrium patens]